jgi:hypothetical protein
MDDNGIVAEVVELFGTYYSQTFQRTLNPTDVEEIVQRPMSVLCTEIDQQHQHFRESGWNYDRVGLYVGMLSFVLGMRWARGERP